METIAAISTPAGKGGIAIVRITGGSAVETALRVFKPRGGGQLSPNKAVYGGFFDGGEAFDDGIAVFFKAPASYTGEDVVELSCHGGLLVTQKLLAACLSAGAVCASAGEFTKRAFINGKITLSQAEAIGGMIDAKSDAHLKTALLQSEGALSKKLGALSRELTFLAASFYAYVDYPDEDMRDVTDDELFSRLTDIERGLSALVRTEKFGKAISEGADCVITGKPNTGKSTLLNLLYGGDRAITDPSAGTTRDIINEQIRLGDVILNLSDTAGIRSGASGIELRGIEKSKKAVLGAQIILFVADVSAPPDGDDAEIIDFITSNGLADRTICVLNKSDLGKNLFPPPFGQSVPFCAENGSGLEALTAAIERLCGKNEISSPGEIIIGARQHSALIKALEAVRNSLYALKNLTQDAAALDVEQAISALGEIDGRQVSEQIVNEIFSRFCVGK